MPRLLRFEDLKPEKGISYSKAQIWRLQQLPPDDPRRFPPPIKGLAVENTYTEPEIDQYVERRIAAAQHNEGDELEPMKRILEARQRARAAERLSEADRGSLRGGGAPP